MALTPEQLQLLQSYMMKNRATPQAVQAPAIQLQPQSSGGVGTASMLSSLGSYFDTPAEIQGPVRPQDKPLGMGVQQSWLSQFADRLDPQAAMQRQMIAKQQNAPKIDMNQIMAALAKAGIK